MTTPATTVTASDSAVCMTANVTARVAAPGERSTHPEIAVRAGRAPRLERVERAGEVRNQHDARKRAPHAARHVAARPQRDGRRQLPAQRGQSVARLPYGEGARERYGDDVDTIRERRAANVLERGLHAERDALHPFGHEERLDHQQTEPVLLAGK